ncbi:MAG: PEP/pyruvate-binding domain-containing protein [Planctomycetota bacterium]
MSAWRERDVPLIGEKAAGLLRLRRHGVPTPDAFCITADACREHVSTGVVGRTLDRLRDAPDESGRSLLSTLRQRIVAAPLSAALCRDVGKHYRALGAASVAVRSSGTMEDRPDAAFAGLHETYLNVTGPTACLEAVVRCWASLWTERAFAYRAERGIDHGQARMAVIVQEFLPAEASGVVFSADPVSGSRERIVIEACLGVGVAVVSGRVSPDRYVVWKGDFTILESHVAEKRFEMVPDPSGGLCDKVVDGPRARGPAISPEAVERLARMAAGLERDLGSPQDVEWAAVGDRLFCLQSRPITALPETTRPEDHQVWSNLNTGEVLPDVVSPMTWSIVEASQEYIAGMFRRAGVDLEDHPLGAMIAGRLYFNINTFIGVGRRMPLARHLDVGTLLGGAQGGPSGPAIDIPDEHIPRIRTGLLRVMLRLPRTLLVLVTHRPQAGFRYAAEMAARRSRFQAMNLRELSEEALVETLDALLSEIFRDRDVFAFPATAMFYFRFLDRGCRRWLGDSNSIMANRLLAGQGGLASAEAGFELWKLAAHARQRAQVCDCLRAADSLSTAREALAASEPGRGFLDRWDRFVDAHGHHTRGEIELFNPRWSETPDYLLGMLRSYLPMMDAADPIADYAVRAREAERLAAACLGRLRNPVKRMLLGHFLKNARVGSAMRENIKSEAMRYVALMRQVLLELGARFRHRGVFEAADEVFFLKRQELATVVRDGPGIDVRKTVESRRREYERNQLITPPPVVTGRFDAARAVVETTVPVSKVLRGIAVSPGVATGPARIILRATGDETVRPGEILVAPFTDPGWTPYFVPAAGIVMDMGGLLSHGSIVAREYGMPAVVNVGPATKMIRTGQMLQVDGDRGEVRILD